MIKEQSFTGYHHSGSFIVIGNFVDAYHSLQETLRENGYFDNEVNEVQEETTQKGLTIPAKFAHMEATFYELGMSQEEVDEFVDFAAKYEAHLNRKQK